MTGFGTYNLPAGTFSDDSSLTFCLAEALTQEFSLQKVGNNFVAWLNNNYWTPRKCFRCWRCDKGKQLNDYKVVAVLNWLEEWKFQIMATVH